MNRIFNTKRYFFGIRTTVLRSPFFHAETNGKNAQFSETEQLIELIIQRSLDRNWDQEEMLLHAQVSVAF